MTDRPLWTPSPERAAATAMARFARAASDAAGRDLADPAGLHRWSVAEPAAFWSLLWDRCGLGAAPGVSWNDRILDRGASMPDARFFPDATLNVAQVIIDGAAPPGDEMLVAVDESGRHRRWSRSEVRAEVAEVAAALRSEGVGPGDRVVAWMPNIGETVVVMLAAASIGAVFSSTSPDFGIDGVLDRFAQIEPTVLVAADGYGYGGRHLDCLDRLAGIVAGLPTVRRTVVVAHLAAMTGGDLDAASVAAIPSAVQWEEWLAPYRGATPTYQPVPFDHPWYILYSSGTTGVPKCIVHRSGGVLVQHLKEHQLHLDIAPGDRVLYYTTCGWMMWNWLVSVPASGATAVLYDGSPFHPGPTALPDLVRSERLSFLGVSAKYLDSLRKSGVDAAAARLPDTVRTVASTGSPLSHESFEWVYAELAPDVHLASISGGTDLCACFVGGDPTRPVYAGEIQGPALGMAVDVVDEDGRSLPAGERGELVCTEPFPSMPLGFWADPDGSRYRAAYFDARPGVWSHGDFASWTEHGGMVLHGRSDTTLNPGGVRIGTAEIYRQVEQLPEVVESLVFGQDWEGDSRIVLLVRLAPGAMLDDGLRDEIRRRIRAGCTPRHVPAVIAEVDDLPRTRSGKLAELAVADAVNGRPVRNTTALANPETLPIIAALAALGRPPEGRRI